MYIITAFLSFTFTLMFLMYAWEFAKFLKKQLQRLFLWLWNRKKKRKKVDSIIVPVERDIEQPVDMQKVIAGLEKGDYDYDYYRKIFGDL